LRCLVTGAAGFIGSHLSESLVARSYDVVGIDNFSDYYSSSIKRKNLSKLTKNGRFKFARVDLSRDDLSRVVRSVDYVFHLAAQPGVRASWGSSFSIYTKDNVVATQRLLEAVKGVRVKRFVFASSSSIYGDSETFPTPEEAVPKPVSPYGVTKLAAEHLCRVYGRNHGVPTVVLRYFTVYGPRQRPDMAFSKFISSVARGSELWVYGDGKQKRDFTYVADVVSATMAARRAAPGSTFNIGGGGAVSLNHAISLIERTVQKKAHVKHMAAQAGDVRNTSADIAKARREIGFRPSVTLEEGLRRQVEASLPNR